MTIIINFTLSFNLDYDISVVDFVYTVTVIFSHTVIRKAF